MTTFDLSPLLRSSVGFDVFDNVFDSVFNLNESNNSYPPYNIVKSDNNYTISLAIAGFSKDEVDISIQENELVVRGAIKNNKNTCPLAPTPLTPTPLADVWTTTKI